VEEHYPQPFFVSLLSRESVSRALVRVALKPLKHSEVPAKITASWISISRDSSTRTGPVIFRGHPETQATGNSGVLFSHRKITGSGAVQ
jgi:hypothetical protein